MYQYTTTTTPIVMETDTVGITTFFWEVLLSDERWINYGYKES